tara:strand:- start:351 stop:731 length:381 start_codon:yes stop_codon:yes gene_type:complete
MRHRKSRRFRHRSNGRNFQSRDNGAIKPNGFLNDRIRGNYKSIQNPEKLVEKYNALAKEALSSGDKISSENFLQHADHFMRMIEFKNLYQKPNKDLNEQKLTSQENKPIDNNKVEVKEAKPEIEEK